MRHVILIAAVLAFGLPASVVARDATGVAALRDPDRLVAIGQRAELRGQPSVALGFYERALAIDPRHLPASRASAELGLRYQLGNEVALARRWAALAPKDAAAQLLVADACLYHGQLNDAEAALTAAAALGADAAAIGARKGLARDLAGDFEAAQLAYAQALSATRDPRAITMRLALSLALSEDYPAALQLLQGYANVPGDNGDVRRTLAKVYAVSGQPEAAGEIMRAAGGDDVAKAMAPYYARLASLPKTVQADALHFDRLSRSVLDGEQHTQNAAEAGLATPSPPSSPPAPPPAPPVASPSIQSVAPPARADNPAYWVQIASTPDHERLADEWRRLQQRAGPVLTGRAAYVQQAGPAHRIVIGPFPEWRDAQALVRQLKARRISALASRIAGTDAVTPLDQP